MESYAAWHIKCAVHKRRFVCFADYKSGGDIMSFLKTGFLFVLLLVVVIIASFYLGSFFGSHFMTVDLSTPVVIVQEPTAGVSTDEPVNIQDTAAPQSTETPAAVIPDTSGEYEVFLPILLTEPELDAYNFDGARRVNVPYFNGDIEYPETAVFWFGRVNSEDNFIDVRLGYNDDDLYINLAVYDRYLWYDTSPSPENFSNWDSVSVFIKPGGNSGDSVDQDSFRFDAMLNWWENSRDAFQAAYQGNGVSWELSGISFTTTTGWRGTAPNSDSGDDRGWVARYSIPFSSLGLSEKPDQQTVWGLGIEVYDRDDSAGTPRTPKVWPEVMDPLKPSTWGQLHFGVPVYTAPIADPAGQVMVRHLLNGAYVPGGAVGGGTTCGAGLSFWDEWGDTSHPGSEDNAVFNVQNQSDVADWPCFARYYLTFPLDAVPDNKIILSARLILHQMGNSGGGQWGTPPNSFIQVFTILEGWDENSITWNNAPLAYENIGGSWVEPIDTFPGWPGVPWEWDVGLAAVKALTEGEPLHLALYSSDSAYHSGKYFVTSYTGDWNKTARPTLVLELGDP
jgi:hypothetical protein